MYMIKLPETQLENTPVDVLNRRIVVSRILDILNCISEKKASCTFALEGVWGSGKTFVLNMLMTHLLEYHYDKYIVFHYNCWQYDYYDEPLIAIIAAMLDSIDEEVHLFPEQLRNHAKVGMEYAKPILTKIATDFINSKIGIDIGEIITFSNDIRKKFTLESAKTEERNSFDEFYTFKKIIQQAREDLSSLSKDRTLVIIVDELDRCFPKYAIKVLERLHHLFDSIENTVVLLAIDQNQLDMTIKQLFGDRTDTAHYLRKFIDFKLKLTNTLVSPNSIMSKYSNLFDSFTYPNELKPFPIDEFIASLLSGIPIRVQEQIMNRIDTVNTLLYNEQKHDISFFCCELLWIILIEQYKCTDEFPLYFTSGNDINNLGFKIKTDAKTRFTQFFESHWSWNYIYVVAQNPFSGNKGILSGDGTMQKLLVYYLSNLWAYYKGEDPTFVMETSDDDPFFSINFEDNLDDLKEATHLLSVIA